jgi:hypothetical protein
MDVILEWYVPRQDSLKGFWCSSSNAKCNQNPFSIFGDLTIPLYCHLFTYFEQRMHKNQYAICGRSCEPSPSEYMYLCEPCCLNDRSPAHMPPSPLFLISASLVGTALSPCRAYRRIHFQIAVWLGNLKLCSSLLHPFSVAVGVPLF